MRFSVKKIVQSFNRQIGVELGSTTTRICVPGKGKVLDEPSLLVIQPQEKKIMMVGQDAKEVEGKMGEKFEVIYPLYQGVIADEKRTVQLLRHFFQKVLGKAFVLKPEVMVSIPSGATAVERQILKEVIFNVGARQVYLIDEPLAAAIGVGVPVADSGGNIILHLGGGHSEVAIISLGSVVEFRSLPIGGSTIDQQLKRFIRRQFEIEISLQEAERLKLRIPVIVTRTKEVIRIKGRSIHTKSPQEIEVPVQALSSVMQDFFQKITDMVVTLLETVPAGLTSDVIDKGIIITGGGSQLAHLDEFLTQQLNVPVAIAERPDECVIKGIELALENLPLYKQSLAFS